MPDAGWNYHVTAYYGPNAKPPKLPGAHAFTAGCADETTAAIEVRAARSRADIGTVVVDPPLTGRAAEWAHIDA